MSWREQRRVRAAKPRGRARLLELAIGDDQERGKWRREFDIAPSYGEGVRMSIEVGGLACLCKQLPRSLP